MPLHSDQSLSSEEYNALLVDVTGGWNERVSRRAGCQRADDNNVLAIGERIFEQEQRGGEHVGYGESVVEQLARDLSARFGRGFSRANVFQMRQFYLTYRAKVQTVSGQFDVSFPLSWSHGIGFRAGSHP
jgi:hypothetical protein